MRFLSAVVSLLLLAAAVLSIYYIVVLFSNINDPSLSDSNKTTTVLIPSEIWDCSDNVSADEPCFGLTMITRDEWLAQPSRNPIEKLDTPAKRIILTDTKTDECSNKPKCNYLVRNIQENQMSSMDDIEYNFLVSTEGDVYEGRGWLLKAADTNDNLSLGSYWIAFIGNFTEIPVSDKQIQAVRRFAERAVSVGKLINLSEIYCLQDNLLYPNYTSTSLIGTFYKCLNTY